VPIETVPPDGGTAAQRLPAIREDASRRRPGVALGRLRLEVRPPTVIEPARLIAGRHPCAWGPDEAEDEVRGLLEQGVTLFLDLTQDGELEPYGRHLPPRVRHVRMAIRDFSVPTPEALVATLDEIEKELAAGGLAYVHCWAGCGRTGVVVGCWLVRHGTAPKVALARIAETRGLGCPQTLEQRLVILGWEAGR
jgi:hypothetical protein